MLVSKNSSKDLPDSALQQSPNRPIMLGDSLHGHHTTEKTAASIIDLRRASARTILNACSIEANNSRDTDPAPQFSPSGSEAPDEEDPRESTPSHAKGEQLLSAEQLLLCADSGTAGGEALTAAEQYLAPQPRPLMRRLQNLARESRAASPASSAGSNSPHGLRPGVFRRARNSRERVGRSSLTPEAERPDVPPASALPPRMRRASEADAASALARLAVLGQSQPR